MVLSGNSAHEHLFISIHWALKLSELNILGLKKCRNLLMKHPRMQSVNSLPSLVDSHVLRMLNKTSASRFKLIDFGDDVKNARPNGMIFGTRHKTVA